MIRELADLIPASLLDVSGSVFYSGRNAFRDTSPLYMLGVNPGGSPDIQAHETIAWHTSKVIEREPDDWSAYRDESWKGAVPGRSGMQPRVLHLLNRVGLSPGSVPASNVVFARSRRESQFSGSLETMAGACWPFHRSVIERLEPRVILCFGGTAGEYVRRQLSANTLIREFVETNNRRWRSCLFRNSSGTAVVVATHPSIANWAAPNTDPSGLVEEALAG
jgi:hypothetical protein